MIEKDSVKLLNECLRGVKMGISSINEVLNYTRSEELKDELLKCLRGHEALEEDIAGLLRTYGDAEEEPCAFIKGISRLKTNMKLAICDSDSTVADLMTDGANMGIKSLSKYLNEYTAAEERAKDIAKRLISEEERLSLAMREYL